jgi:integrase/recombinase XerD
MDQLEVKTSPQGFALDGDTALQFRVRMGHDDARLKARFEAEGLRWMPDLGYYLLDAAPCDAAMAIASIDAIAARLAGIFGGLVPEGQSLGEIADRVADVCNGIETAALPSLKLSATQLEILQRFEACVAQHQYSPKTLRNYKNAFRSFLVAISPRLPLDLSKQAVEAWLTQATATGKRSTALQNTLINALKFYYVAVEGRPSGGYVFERPKSNVAAPKSLTKAEVQALLTHTTNLKHRCLLLLAYGTGLRLKELLGLRRSDVHFEGMRVTIAAAPGKKKREVPLSPKLVQGMRAYLLECNPQCWLFEGERFGEPYSERSAQMVVKHAADRAGLQRAVSMNMLRNSFATHQLEAGIAVEAVQDLMGHDSIRTTGRYAHVARRRMPASPADSLEF